MPRILALDKHWSSDETLWLNRSKTFMFAIKQGEFSETIIAYHPGVITMWAAGLRVFFTDLDIDVKNLAVARWILGIIVSIGITVSFLLLHRLFGVWISLVGVIGLAFSPMFIAQTRRVHTDALAATFILLTVLLFLCYCQKRQHHRYLTFSGITFGLALLSKSYSLILLPWIPFCLFLFRNSSENTAWLKRSTTTTLYFLNCSLLTVIIGWPVFWTLPFGILGGCLLGTTFVLIGELKKKTPSLSSLVFWTSILVLGATCIRTLQIIPVVLEKVNWAITTPHNVAHLFLGKVINDPGWLFYLFALTIKSTPLMLPLAICGVLLSWKRRKCCKAGFHQFQVVIALGTAVTLFIVCLSATSKKFPRYLLPVFVMLEVIAAVGFVELFLWSYSWLNIRSRQLARDLKKAFIVITCLGGLLIEVIPVLALHPYYGTYYNPCWKVTDITKIITVGDASGLDMAAKYLNEKDNPTQMNIQASFIAAEFLRYYFLGNIHFSKPISDTHIQYEVVYIRDSQIGWPPKQGIYNGQLEHVINLNGIELVWIYRLEKPD